MRKAVTSSSTSTKKRRPALSPEARENQMISLAVDLAEKQLIEGTASSQVITHFLKLASTKERIEKEILEKQKELIEVKAQAIRSSQYRSETYDEVLKAFRSYQGVSDPDGDSDDEY